MLHTQSSYRSRLNAETFKVLGLNAEAKAKARLRGDRANRTDPPFLTRPLLASREATINVRDGCAAGAMLPR